MHNEIANLGNRANQMEERIGDIKGRKPNMTEKEEERTENEKKKMNQELSDTVRKSNIRIMNISEGDEKEKGTGNLLQ